MSGVQESIFVAWGLLRAQKVGGMSLMVTSSASALLDKR